MDRRRNIPPGELAPLARLEGISWFGLQAGMARPSDGSGLDVFDQEPLPASHPLRTLDNVVLTPHMGSATFSGRIAMGEKVLINIKSFTDGNPPPDRVLLGVTA